MSKPFRRLRGPRYAGAFHPAEADLLRSLVAQLTDLLAEEGQAAADPGSADPLAAAVGIEPSAERPRDPVLLRLFPDAYRDDPGAAEDFRRFTQRGLREAKVAAAQAVLASLDAGTAQRPDRLDITLDDAGAHAWLRTLTDLRLALGTRLGVEQDDDARWEALPADDPAAYVHDVYDWLGWVQETLVQAMSRR